MRRRDFLTAAAALAAGACTPRQSADSDGTGTSSNDTGSTNTAPAGTGSTNAPPPSTDPPVTVAPLTEPSVDLPEAVFALGVASGDPGSDSVVLWTRLIGELPGGVPLLWEVAHDEGFVDLAATGLTEATADFAHSAHVIVTALQPDLWYWYRFRVGGQTSPVGRTRTMPAPGQAGAHLRIGLGCCQRKDGGYWSAHHDIAAAGIDLFVWLGDFIYSETSSRPVPGREHRSNDPVDLAGYRARYADYRSDPALQASSAAQPWVATWDDHEVFNDYTSASIDPRRRADAYRAWWEHQPTRLAPPADTLEIYQTIDLGSLGRVVVTDTRQHADGVTLLGTAQREWLAGALDHAGTWTIMASSVLVGGLLVPTQREPLLAYTWDGYPSERAWLADQLALHPNRICVSGDLHVAAALEVRGDPGDRSLPVVATEFIAPAISSSFLERYEPYLPFIPLANAHIDYIEAANGWLLLELTAEKATAEFRLLTDVTLPDQTLAAGARYEILNGGALTRSG